MSTLLTETADYDAAGSWSRASAGWPEIRGDVAFAMYVFANCVRSIPYGSYVLGAHRGQYGAVESVLRVHTEHVEQLKRDFARAGMPDPDISVARRDQYGAKNDRGLREKAPLWEAAQ